MNISLLLIPLFFVGLVLYVAMPLLKEHHLEVTARPTAPEGEDRQVLLRAWEDDRMDYLTSKISAEEYQSMRAHYERLLNSIKGKGKVRENAGER